MHTVKKTFFLALTFFLKTEPFKKTFFFFDKVKLTTWAEHLAMIFPVEPWKIVELFQLYSLPYKWLDFQEFSQQYLKLDGF